MHSSVLYSVWHVFRIWERSWLMQLVELGIQIQFVFHLVSRQSWRWLMLLDMHVRVVVCFCVVVSPPDQPHYLYSANKGNLLTNLSPMKNIQLCLLLLSIRATMGYFKCLKPSANQLSHPSPPFLYPAILVRKDCWNHNIWSTWLMTNHVNYILHHFIFNSFW